MLEVLEVMSGLGLFVIILGILIFLLLVIILPISAYAAQKWAYRSCKELEKLNSKIDRFLSKQLGTSAATTSRESAYFQRP